MVWILQVEWYRKWKWDLRGEEGWNHLLRMRRVVFQGIYICVTGRNEAHCFQYMVVETRGPGTLSCHLSP